MHRWGPKWLPENLPAIVFDEIGFRAVCSTGYLFTLPLLWCRSSSFSAFSMDKLQRNRISTNRNRCSRPELCNVIVVHGALLRPSPKPERKNPPQFTRMPLSLRARSILSMSVRLSEQPQHHWKMILLPAYEDQLPAPNQKSSPWNLSILITPKIHLNSKTAFLPTAWRRPHLLTSNFHILKIITSKREKDCTRWRIRSIMLTKILTSTPVSDIQ